MALPLPEGFTEVSQNNSLAIPEGFSEVNASAPKPVAKTLPSGFMRRAAIDMPLALAKGVIGAGEFAVGLGDLATGGYAGKGLQEIGYDPKKTKEILSSLQTEEQRLAEQNVAKVKGFIPSAQAMIENPSTIASGIVESTPSLIGAGGLARTALKVVPKIGGALAAGIGEGLVTAGSTAETIRQQTPEGVYTDIKQPLAALGAGVLTGGIGWGAGKLVGTKLGQKLGLVDIDVEMAKGMNPIGETIASGKPANLLKRIPTGMVTEGVLEEMPQSYQEQVMQNVGLGKEDVFEGASESAAAGLITGGIMGGGMNAISTPINNRRQAIIDAADKGKQEGIAQAEAEVANGAQPISILADETSKPPEQVQTESKIAQNNQQIDTEAQNQLQATLQPLQDVNTENLGNGIGSSELTSPTQDMEAEIDLKEQKKAQFEEDIKHQHIVSATNDVNESLLSKNPSAKTVHAGHIANASRMLYSAVKNVKEFTAGLVQRFGEAIKSHALKLWNWAKVKLKDERGLVGRNIDEYNEDNAAKINAVVKPVAYWAKVLTKDIPRNQYDSFAQHMGYESFEALRQDPPLTANGNPKITDNDRSSFLKQVRSDKEGTKPVLSVQEVKEKRQAWLDANKQTNYTGEESKFNEDTQTFEEDTPDLDVDESLQYGIEKEADTVDPDSSKTVFGRMTEKKSHQNETGYRPDANKEIARAIKTGREANEEFTKGPNKPLAASSIYADIEANKKGERVYGKVQETVLSFNKETNEFERANNDVRIKKALDQNKAAGQAAINQIKVNKHVPEPTKKEITNYINHLVSKEVYLKPVFEDVLRNEGVASWSSLKGFPTLLTDISEKLVGKKEEEQFTPQTEKERAKHEEADNAKPIVQKAPKDVAAESIDTSGHKEKAFKQYEKDYIDKNELFSLAKRVMHKIDEYRNAGKNIDVKAKRLKEDLQNYFSELKGNDALYTKVIRLLSVDNKADVNRVITELFVRPNANHFEPKMLAYIFGSLLTEEQLKQSERVNPSEVRELNLQTPLIDDTARVNTVSTDMDAGDFQPISLLNKQTLKKTAEQLKDKDYVGSEKQYIYTVLLPNKDGKEIETRLSQNQLDQKLNEGFDPKKILEKSVNKLDVLQSDYHNRPLILNKAHELGYVGDNVKDAKDYLLQNKIAGMTVLSPAQIKSLELRLSNKGLNLTAADIYDIYSTSGYDVARTLSTLKRLVNINDTFAPRMVDYVVRSLTEGYPVFEVGTPTAMQQKQTTVVEKGFQQPIKPTKPTEPKGNVREEKDTRSLEQKETDRLNRIAVETLRLPLQDVYKVKPYKDLTATEKTFMEAMSNRYEPLSRPIVGKLSNGIVHNFFTKIADMFGAELIVLRNGKEFAPSGAKYLPNVTTGKPVLAIDLDSPLSFTRLFAHELFHHILNKVSQATYDNFKLALKSVVDEKKWNETVTKMMMSRKDFNDEQKYELTKEHEYNQSFTKQSGSGATNQRVQFTNKIAYYESVLDKLFPSWMVKDLQFKKELEGKPLPEKEKLLKAKIRVIDPNYKLVDNQKLRESIEEELHAELFSYAFTKKEFWEVLTKTFEGKSLAAKLITQFMGNATKVIEMFQDIGANTKQGSESLSAQITRDAALRSLITDFFDVKDFVDGKPTYQGGLYEMLANVVNEAYLNKEINKLRHLEAKSMTKAEVASGVKEEVIGLAKTGTEHLTSAFKNMKGMKSHRDLMTAIENVLLALKAWIAKVKPNGIFADFMADPKQVEIANKIAYYGSTMAQHAYHSVVTKHQDAFKGLSPTELEDLHDKVVRSDKPIDEITGLTDEQRECFKAYKEITDKLHERLKEVYPNINYRANHFGQSIRWTKEDNTLFDDNFDWAIGDETSQLKGDERYAKGKDTTRTTREIADTGLKYTTIDPHELFINYIKDAYNLVALKEQTDAAIQGGIIQIFTNQGAANKAGFVPVDDNAFKVFKKMNVAFGYKIDVEGDMFKANGQDIIYPTLKDANDALNSYQRYDASQGGGIASKDAKVVPVVPEYKTATSHYQVYRVEQVTTVDKWGKEHKNERKQAVWNTLDENKAKEFVKANYDETNKDVKYEYEAIQNMDVNDNPNVQVAQMYIKPDLARMLKVLLSKDKFRNASAFGISGNQVMDVKNAITSMELMVSMFHAFTIGQEVTASTIAWRQANKKGGLVKSILNPFQALKDSREIVTLFKESMANPKIVNDPSFKKKMNELLGTEDADVYDVINQYFGHGGELHQDVSLRSKAHGYGNMKYNKGDVVTLEEGKLVITGDNKRLLGVIPINPEVMKKSFGDAWEKQLKENPDSIMSAIGKTTMFGLLEAPTAWLMEEGIPRIKMAMFAREYTLKLEQQKELLQRGETTREEIARDTMKFVEDRFGEVNWQNMWMDKTVKTWLQFLFRSFTWFSGSFKALGKSGFDIAKWGWFALKDKGLDPKDKTNYKLTEKGKWGIAALYSHIASVAFISLLFTLVAGASGEEPEETPEDTSWLTRLLFPRSSFSDGNARISVPSYMTEAYKIMLHMGALGSEAEYSKLISGRFNGLISKIYDMYRGEDFRGVSIRNKADNVFEQTLDTILYIIPKPIMISSQIQDAKTKGWKPQDLGIALMGLTSAPASALRTEATNKAFELGRKEYKGKELTEDDMAEKDMLKRAMFAWQNGDKSKIDELRSEGRVSERQIQIAKARYPKLMGQKNVSYVEPLGTQLKRLTIEGAIEVYDKMTDGEKAKYKADIRKKYFNMLAREDKPLVKKNEIKAKMKEINLL